MGTQVFAHIWMRNCVHEGREHACLRSAKVCV